jgi:hypothetical protein
MEIFLSQRGEMITSMKRQRRNQLWYRIRDAVDGYAVEIVRLICESYGAEAVRQAWSEFTIGAGEEFDCSGPHAELFFSWLFHRWSPARENGHTVDDHSLYGVTPTRAYLDRNGRRLDPLLRCYLETCLATSPAFYEVFNCKPYVGFRARDMMTGSECDVTEGLASTSLSDGEIMFAHLVPIERTTVLEAISPQSFPPQFKKQLIRSFRGQPPRELSAPELRRLYFFLAQAEACQPAARFGRCAATYH